MWRQIECPATDRGRSTEPAGQMASGIELGQCENEMELKMTPKINEEKVVEAEFISKMQDAVKTLMK